MNSRLDHITDWQTRAERARFRVNILAKICGVTDRQLRRYFTAKFGSSPHSWLTITRLEKVRPLLCQGDLVKEAAAIAGFSQQANFSRQFKRFYHANPSSFRVPVA